MILTCPNCGTQYVVKDGAVPPQGRQVRCAACKHSWHQDPDPREAVPATGESTQAAGPEDHDPIEREDAEHESIAEATLIEPRSGPALEERAFEEAVIGGSEADEVVPETAKAGQGDDHGPASADERGVDASALSGSDGPPPIAEESGASATFAPDYDIPPGAQPSVAPAIFTSNYDAPPTAQTEDPDEFSPFVERGGPAPRGRSAFVSVALVVVAIAVLAAIFWFVAPQEWRARVGLGEFGKTPLELMITHPDRQKLASGQESLTISGRVINPTDATHAIPPIYAQLKSRTGLVIYSWTIAPPAPSLGPRASTSFNSTEVDVPPGGDDLTISLGSPKP